VNGWMALLIGIDLGLLVYFIYVTSERHIDAAWKRVVKNLEGK
jgi:hypothetical protein